MSSLRADENRTKEPFFKERQEGENSESEKVLRERGRKKVLRGKKERKNEKQEKERERNFHG